MRLSALLIVGLLHAGAVPDSTVLTGRLFDWPGNPIVSSSVSVRISYADSSRWSEGSTDEEGVFSIVLSGVVLMADEVTLELGYPSTSSSRDPDACYKRPRRRIDVTNLRAPGTHDLGNVVLELPFLVRLDRDPPVTDADLEQELRRHLASDSASREDRIVLEACLTEMLRRGSERFEELLRRALATRKEQAERDERSHIEKQLLPLLTALRRLEGKPDPVRLVVTGSTDLALSFPELPVLELALVNLDVGKETVHLTCGGDYRSGRFARCRIEGLDPGGEALPVLPSPSGIGGGLAMEGPFGPGAEEEIVLPLASFVRLRAPGVHELRVQYHDEFAIADRSRVDRLIVLTSDPVRLRWEPRVVRLSEEQERVIRRWIGALDDSEPVLLVDGPFREGVEPSLPETKPQLAILKAGWKAVPVLIDALGAPENTPERCAWLLALLYDLTGVLDPWIVPGALGKTTRARGWRSSMTLPLDGPRFRRTRIGPRSEDQAPLIESWKRLAVLVPIERPG